MNDKNPAADGSVTTVPISKHPLVLLYFSLSDETRLRVVRLMATIQSNTFLSELAHAMDIPMSKLSKHVNLLAWAGIIKQERSGSWVLLSLNRDVDYLEHLYASITALPDQEEIFSTDLTSFGRIKRKQP